MNCKSIPKSCCRQHGNYFLQRVAVFAADSHQISLDGSLRFFLRILNQLHDIPCFFDRNALLHRDFALGGSTGGGFDRAVGQSLQRNAALHQLLLQDVIHRLQLVLVGRMQHDRVLFQFDIRLRILQIEASVDFLQCLLDGIGNLLQIDLAHDVKSVIGHRISILSEMMESDS